MALSSVVLVQLAAVHALLKRSTPCEGREAIAQQDLRDAETVDDGDRHLKAALLQSANVARARSRASSGLNDL